MEITYQEIKKLSVAHGYVWFTGPMNLNIFGLRNADRVVNLFNDIIGIAYTDADGREQCKFWHGSTKPGLFYLGDKLLNGNGTFILMPGFYKACWHLGLHKQQYRALVQRGSGVFKGWRDANKNGILDYTGKIWTDVAGLNLHTTSYKTNQEKVGAWSAGCQIIQNAADFEECMSIVEQSAKLYGSVFSYKLFQL